ncbi:MAG: hypothetical protein NTY50_20270 [Methylobacter sp.]|nr:hypothetical protein [Methylobacter sp.]
MSKLKSACSILLIISMTCFASSQPTDEKWNNLYNQWMSIHYSTLQYLQKTSAFQSLLNRIVEQQKTDQKAVQAIVLEALVYCSYAEIENGLSSLSYVGNAYNLLKRAESLDPTPFEGTVYSTLGALYSQVPGWPISFGDKKLAKQYLELALHLYPNAADTNYLYGHFLLSQGQPTKAYPYLYQAANAPIRASQRLVDIHAKADAVVALNAIKN